MKTIKIPYYTSTLDLHVDEANLKAVVTAKMHEYKAEKSEEELVKDALAHPIGSKTLRELAVGKKKVTLVTSDHTRAVPSKLTLPILLAEIRAGNPDADITILIGTGLHRPTTEAEQRRMFGDAIVDNEKIAVNNAFEPDDFVKVCDLPSGAEFFCNKIAVDCDLLVCEGFIEPHFFAGFSGGRKSILPGICNAATVNENHSYKAIADPHSVTGVLEGNPIHKDMVCAARAVNVQFIMNVALDGEKKVVAAWAGDLEEAHAAGVQFIREQSQCPSIEGDIVVTSNGGYPLDPQGGGHRRGLRRRGRRHHHVLLLLRRHGRHQLRKAHHPGHRGRDRRLPLQDPAQGDHLRAVVPPDLLPHPAPPQGDPGHHLPGPRRGAQGQHDPRLHTGRGAGDRLWYQGQRRQRRGHSRRRERDGRQRLN